MKKNFKMGILVLAILGIAIISGQVLFMILSNPLNVELSNGVNLQRFVEIFILKEKLIVIKELFIGALLILIVGTIISVKLFD